MNGLTNGVHRLVHLNPGFGHGILGGVDGAGQHAAALVNSLRVTALLQRNTPGFQKIAQVLVQLPTVDLFHNVVSGTVAAYRVAARRPL